MDGAWLRRMRWRRRGAWLWPAFCGLVVVDAFVGHALPPSGESQTLLGGALTGCVLSLIGIVLLSRPLGGAVRKLRPDLPKVVARDYAGTGVVLAVAALLLAAGLLHRPAVVSHQRSMRDAITRAQAFIGDRAPAAFRRNVAFVNIFTIQAGSIYRMCVPDDTRTRSYCVVVKTRLPFAQSVSFAGYEPNSIFGAGTG